MAKIIEFPSQKIEFISKFQRKIQDKFKNMPELGACLEKAFVKIYEDAKSSEIRSFSLELPGNPPQKQVAVIREAISELLERHKTIVLDLLKKIAAKESEICLLNHHLSKIKQKGD